MYRDLVSGLPNPPEGGIGPVLKLGVQATAPDLFIFVPSVPSTGGMKKDGQPVKYLATSFAIFWFFVESNVAPPEPEQPTYIIAKQQMSITILIFIFYPHEFF